MTESDEIIWESASGITASIDAYVEARGGWVCEQHPWLGWPHGDCEGPGTVQEQEHAP